MNFDVFTIAAVVAEINTALAHGKVQDTLELGDEAVGFEIYASHARRYLLVSAHPQTARVHFVADRVRRGVENPSPLGLMLRRFLEGSRFVRASQPPWERIIHLEFETLEGNFTLIAEPMERRANVLLVKDGRILDCVRRVGADENRVRVSLPNYPYVPPPPQSTKHVPFGMTAAHLQGWLNADANKAAWRILTEKLLGFSPMLAKEAIYRAMGRLEVKAGSVDAGALAAAINGLMSQLEHKAFTPGNAMQDGIPIAFAAYEITHLEGWQPTETISEALSVFYGAPIGIDAYKGQKVPVQTQLDEAIEKVTRRLEALRRSQRDEAEREYLKQSGELILAYQYQIAPKQTTFSAQYDFDAPPLEIKLDPTLSALDNAKAYFEKYEKAKRAAAEVPALIKAAENELAYLQQLAVDLAVASSYPEIGEVQDALQSAGYWRGTATRRPSGQKSQPLRLSTPEGFVIWVGKNARQNDEVTFGKGRPEDMWLHVRGAAGSHVIIKTGGRPVPQSVLQRAANLAAYYSAARNENRVLVDVTERRHVRKIKGGAAGMVTYRNEQPIEATPKAESG
ncbi:MAG: NFACT RNA binding domain-containing protein [Anaerolineae bacterium]